MLYPDPQLAEATSWRGGEAVDGLWAEIDERDQPNAVVTD